MTPHIFGTYRRATTVDDAAGVYAGQHTEGHYDTPDDLEVGDWGLWLPHDCDEWVIASGSREEVIARGRDFVASLRDALDSLEGA